MPPRPTPNEVVPAPRIGSHVLAALALFSLATALYLPCLGGGFVFDDPNAVSQSSLIRSIRPLTRFLKLSTRPLSDLSYAIDHAIGGLDPWQFHATNVLLHALNAVLVYVLVWQTLGLGLRKRTAPRRGSGASTGWAASISSHRMLVAFASAALFAAHPLASETVAYVSSRSEELLAFFFLLTLIAYGRAAAGDPGSRRAFVVAVPVATAAALGSKEIAVTIPPFLLLYDWCFLARGNWRATRSRWSLIGLSLVPLAVGGALLLFRAYTSGTGLGSYGQTAGVEFHRFGRGEYLMTEFGALVHYLRLVVLPVGLTFDYDWKLARAFWAPGVLLPLAFLAVLVAAAVRRVRADPAFTFAILGMLLILAPTSSVIPVADPVVERRMYIPLVGFALLAAVWLWQATGRLRRARSEGRFRLGVYATTLAALLAVLGSRTIVRATLWGDPVALHRDGVARAPGNPRVRLNLGVTYLNLGRLDEAETELLEAKRLYDRGESIHAFRRIGAFIHYNLGAVLFLRKKYAQSARELKVAVRLGGEYLALRTMGLLLLGRIAEQDNDWGLAAARYEEALRHDRQNADRYVDLARARMNNGERDKAVAAARTAIRLEPGNEGAAALLEELRQTGARGWVKRTPGS